MLKLNLDLDLGLRRFRKSRKERFLIYLGASDCVNHMGGLGATRGFLKKLDHRLARLLRQLPELRIILLYPLAVNRVWELCDGLVANQANVVISLDRGTYAGSPWLDFFVTLKATHGGLSDLQSSGFVAASHENVPALLTAAQAGHLISEKNP